jgi:Flp pilus assembly protein TadG
LTLPVLKPKLSRAGRNNLPDADLNMKNSNNRRGGRERRAVTLFFAAFLMVVMLGIVAFAIDVGYIVLVRTQLQAAADSSAIAATAVMTLPRGEMTDTAKQFAAYHLAAGKNVQLLDKDIEYGTWDAGRRSFAPSPTPGNAVRVTAKCDKTTTGEVGFFFAGILNSFSFTRQASAVAMANPRDIAFVVDLSGSMNDDTEPCWATDVENSTFAPAGYPTVGSDLMQQVYSDFGFGAYPGTLEYLGAPAGVPKNSYAYAELTKDGGYLTTNSIPVQYRIQTTDSEVIRKQKGYSWVIDYQIARVMPNAKPTPDSIKNYAYWEKYLDYLSLAITITPPSPPAPTPTPTPSPSPTPTPTPTPTPSPTPTPPRPTIGWRDHGICAPWFAAWTANPTFAGPSRGAARLMELQLAMTPGSLDAVLLSEMLSATSYGTPPANRGTIPPNRYSGRIDACNNPNADTFPAATISVPRGYRNYIGYRTYVQFMMDHGRDAQPVNGTYVPLSQLSADCPWHMEETAGGTFNFPPREQPSHAARRALIAAMQVIKDRNSSIGNLDQRDWVSIVTFDKLTGGGPVVIEPLTGDYDQAMLACTTLQACSDVGATTATETGLITARALLQPKKTGGSGRLATNKVVVLLTDGVPNLYSSSAATIKAFIGSHADLHDFYNNGAYWCDAALMQVALMKADHWDVYPVGVGLGTDYDFMDRMARMGGTADGNGHSPRGSGNPAQYEQTLTDIFRKIITSPRIRLVQ